MYSSIKGDANKPCTALTTRIIREPYHLDGILMVNIILIAMK
jgi:hypothetical protein